MNEPKDARLEYYRGLYAEHLRTGKPIPKAAKVRRAVVMNEPGAMTVDEWEAKKESYLWTCSYCGGPGPLTVDHIVPISKGGRHTVDNVTPACQTCNVEKGDRSLELWGRELLPPLKETEQTND